MPDFKLSDKTSDAERILNGVLAGSRTSSTEAAPMGCVVLFELSSGAAAGLESKVLILEHSCDESVRIGAFEPWLSDVEAVERVLRLVPGRSLECVRVFDDGELHILWHGEFGLRLRPADYSMDWQWQVAPLDRSSWGQFSVVSVHGGKVFTRYPSRLDSLCHDS
jgi:hypothetical protein